SERVLAASPTGVLLDEMQGELRRLVHMLSGAPAAPRAVGPFRLRPPLEDTPASPMIALPPAIDHFDAVEDHARLYKSVAASLAGRRELGTYEALPEGASTLRGPGRAPVLEQLFLLADGVRVAARLTAAYPGVGEELRWAAREMLAGSDWASIDVFDTLYALALCAEPPIKHLPPWLAGVAQLVLPSVQPLAHPGATARDALRVAERLAALFPDTGAADEGLGVLPDLVTVLLDAGSGATPPGDGEAGRPGGVAGAGDDEPLPDDVQEALTLLVDEHLGDITKGGRALDPEALRRLIETLGTQALAQARGDLLAQAGLYLTQLVGKRLAAGEVV